jgi:hypothetical protein
MTRILNANMKKFMGAKYERVAKTLVIWTICFSPCVLPKLELKSRQLLYGSQQYS